MEFVSIQKLSKSYAGVNALEDVNLEIREGELFALLGPSGCGKTTTMRCIAGFEEPTSGIIRIGGKDIRGIPAHRRNCGMVFQSYALFPHLTVFENVAYPLNLRRFYREGPVTKLGVLAGMISRRWTRTPPKIREKVEETLELVELNHLKDRLPNQLSGGQQQRVALARAIIMEPSLLLMDEPLSNLDKKLRGSMRKLICDLQRKLGITTIFVTHDQEEAMSMADRIAVMKEGRVVQTDTPSRLYSRPATTYVADFVGSSNLFQARVKVEEQSGNRLLSIGSGLDLVSAFTPDGGTAEVLIRPESFSVFPREGELSPPESKNCLEARVIRSTYLGSKVRYEMETKGTFFQVDVVYTDEKTLLGEGDPVWVTLEPEQVVVL
ncbi:polyamine-transporting ATPase [Kroppenstedtia guangzhouensis]|uniref:Polyamine-transporting ATPase n=1 Tax=Kroppenstedtia guangzhouensis TaxID=1274356 RepID=A0ABQ1FYC8_9BACL|nr:ABC transporter ATP-binding protein [Kroppenstedtia guangzhouensis]GGA32204.1 polyamine-transporting ATPase [Kroppenstedtia guangzhouensis]